MSLEEKIALWIREEVEKARAEGVVMGLSGGVDSAVAAVLAKKAVGKNFLSLILPCHSDNEDLQDAWAVVNKFRLKALLYDLTGVYDEFVRLFPESDTMSSANLKARLRMCTLYLHANQHNYLVCGTGNKSELLTGYFTKYGDGGVDLLPLGDLLKTEVRALAKKLRIPAKIITKPPTAGLWAGQTDEKELGISYEELDRNISLIENKKSVMRLHENAKKVMDMMNRTAHKREPIKVFKKRKI